MRTVCLRENEHFKSNFKLKNVDVIHFKINVEWRSLKLEALDLKVSKSKSLTNKTGVYRTHKNEKLYRVYHSQFNWTE